MAGPCAASNEVVEISVATLSAAYKVKIRPTEKIHELKKKICQCENLEYSCLEGIATNSASAPSCLCSARGAALVDFGRERAMRLDKSVFALDGTNDWKKFVKSDQDTCSLCLNIFALDGPTVRDDLVDFNATNQIVVGECGHAFHECCLLSHFKSANKMSCPMCQCGFKYVNEGAKLVEMADSTLELTDNGATQECAVTIVTKQLDGGERVTQTIELQDNDTAGAVKKRVMSAIGLPEADIHKYCLSGSGGIFFDDDEITSLSSYPPVFALCGTSEHNCCKTVAYEVIGDEVPKDEDGLEVSKGAFNVSNFHKVYQF